MHILEILLIIFSILVVVGTISFYLYRKYRNLSTGECAHCHKSRKKLLKEYRKMYNSNNKNE
ncbi:MAG TPA: hypothetical protein GX010_03450 [Erysipelotrichaceae bacterium]|nr:hypothetical protein [Erysipelotrichaceae bacterium]